jgi:hypothetical protein
MRRDPLGGLSPGEFWPPAAPTSVVLAEAVGTTRSVSFGEAAMRTAAVLDDAGYVEKRWYPIGPSCAHGFAVTTRVERLDRDRGEPSERWMPLLSGPVTLKWLGDARRPRFPRPGRYQALLVAFTDLFVREPHQPAREDLDTLMEGVDGTATAFPPERRASPRFRYGAYLYEYDAEGPDGSGVFVQREPTAVSLARARASGLSRLLEIAD